LGSCWSSWVEPYFVCDECDPCCDGNYHLCTRIRIIGFADGSEGLSETILVD
jgi:(R,R)-butanediol dehydrogenase/meso-butanediol dehydrogenase/diacetyl reductase